MKSKIKANSQNVANPFIYSDTNKRYHTYDYYLKQRFGSKCAKIPIDAHMTCPNIDGSKGFGGCIYCSGGGVGASANCCMDIEEQYKRGVELLADKWHTDKYIPYLQYHTNTYSPLPVLKELYEKLLKLPGAVGLNIATRADCLPDRTVDYLADIAERTVLTVELGLQSIHDSTAKLINRGHTYEEFLDGYERLRHASDKINIAIHLIDGLPGEDPDMMLATAKAVGCLKPDMVKIHSLYVNKGTRLFDMYDAGEFTPIKKEEYIDILVRQLEVLPPETVIGRITGDGERGIAVAPDWAFRKVDILNGVDKKMFAENTWQGRLYGK